MWMCIGFIYFTATTLLLSVTNLTSIAFVISFAMINALVGFLGYLDYRNNRKGKE